MDVRRGPLHGLCAADDAGGHGASGIAHADVYGVVNCDRAKMYWNVGRPQWCWARLKRDFQALIDHPDHQMKHLGRDLLRPTHELFRYWSRCRDGTLTRRAMQRLMKPIRQEIDGLLLHGAFSGNPKLYGMCEPLYQHRNWLWTFLDVAGVAPTHNASERALRPAVIWRKLSFGTQSAAESRFVETILTAPWTPLKFDQFGLHAQLEVKVRQTLYYASGRNRLLTIVLMRDTVGERPEQMFYCTNLTLSAEQILGTYACRWSIEVTFENTKQLLGLEDPANRLPRAVERTAPMALFLYSLSVLWFHLEGHRHVQFPYRPWYRQKREPSFADIFSTLRRRTWTNILWGGHSQPPPTKIALPQLANSLCRAA